MSTKRDFQVIIKNTDMNDADELRDVLTMLALQVDKDRQQIKQLKSEMKRVHEAVPSTATRK